MVAIVGGPKRLSTQMRGVADGFFIPLFFVVLGARLDVGGLFEHPELLGPRGCARRAQRGDPPDRRGAAAPPARRRALAATAAARRARGRRRDRALRARALRRCRHGDRRRGAREPRRVQRRRRACSCGPSASPPPGAVAPGCGRPADAAPRLRRRGGEPSPRRGIGTPAAAYASGASSVSLASSACARPSSCSRCSSSSCVTLRCERSTSARTSSSTSRWVSLRGLAERRGAADPGRHSEAPRPGPTRGAHPPAPDHVARDLGELLDVGLGAGADRLEHDLLRHAAAEGHVDLRLQLLERVGDAVALGRRERHPERHPARDDRHLAHRVGALGEHAHERVAGLVVGGALAIGGRSAGSLAARRAGASRASR